MCDQYQCEHCGAIFTEEELIVEEIRGSEGYPVFGTFCPVCEVETTGLIVKVEVA